MKKGDVKSEDEETAVPGVNESDVRKWRWVEWNVVWENEDETKNEIDVQDESNEISDVNTSQWI